MVLYKYRTSLVHQLITTGNEHGEAEPPFQDAKIGDNVTFRCLSFSPDVYWRFNGQTLPKNAISHISELFLAFSSEVHIVNVGQYNEGSYVCHGKDSEGNELIDETILEVHSEYNNEGCIKILTRFLQHTDNERKFS